MENDALEQLLTLLRKHGVTHFKQGALEVRLGKPAAAPPRDPEMPVRNANERAVPPRPASPYESPSLWPNGKRPSFADD